MKRDIFRNFYYGKKALITGGSSGIGFALARQLAASGASIWLVARDMQKLKLAELELKTITIDPAQIIGFSQADVTVESQARDAVKDALKAMGSLDLLINSAGIAYPGYFQDLPLDIFRRQMETNYFGALYITYAAVPEMIRRSKGHIVNLSSAVAFLALFGLSAYAPSKWALRGLSDVLRYELKSFGIRVSNVMPPDTDTPQLKAEKSIRPVELDIISANNQIYTAETVARDILLGVKRNRYIIITGLDTKFFYWLSNILGSLQYFVMDILVKDAIRKKKKAKT